MYAPPLSHFFWAAPATATPGSAPWPLMLWFEEAAVSSPGPFVNGNLDVWRVGYRQRVTHIAPHRNMKHRYE